MVIPQGWRGFPGHKKNPAYVAHAGLSLVLATCLNFVRTYR